MQSGRQQSSVSLPLQALFKLKRDGKHIKQYFQLQSYKSYSNPINLLLQY